MATKNLLFSAGPIAAAVRHSCRPLAGGVWQLPAARAYCHLAAPSRAAASSQGHGHGHGQGCRCHRCSNGGSSNIILSLSSLRLGALSQSRAFAAGPGAPRPGPGGPAAQARTRPGTKLLLATTGVSLVASLIMYEVILWNVSSASSAAGDPDASSVWNPNWDNPTCFAEAKLEVEASPEERTAGLALELRRMGDANVQRRHLIFVRHAQPASSGSPAAASEDEEGTPTKGNKKKGSATASNLSAEGLKQAKLVGKHLRNVFGDVDSVYHGIPGECKATAKIISRALRDPKTKAGPPTIESDLFNEVLPVLPSPAPEGIEVDEGEMAIDAHRADCLFHGVAWVPTPQKDQRGLASVEVFVCPGNLMRYLVCRALQLPPSVWSRMAANHATVTWIEIGEDASVTLREFGGTGHLTPDLMTYH